MTDLEKRVKHLEKVVLGEADNAKRKEQEQELRHLERRRRYAPELFSKDDLDKLEKAREDVKKHT
ncbi:MAG: hypothetical protein ACRBBN_15695 [Methyloligellaceae bacterium]